MTSKRKSFVLHIDSLEILDDLTNDQAGVLFKAIKAYQNDESFNLESIVKMVFIPFKNQFIRDNEKYSKTCERRAVAGSKGGKQKVANASKCLQKVANVADSVSKNKNDSKNDSKSDSNKEVTRRFTPPTDIETVSYFQSNGSTNIEAEKFWFFYDSKNWLVGKSKMKKWQSAASGWIKRNETKLTGGKTSGNLSACEDFING